MTRRELRGDWKDTAVSSWSIRIGVFWSLVTGAWAFWPALQEYVPLWLFVAGCLAFPVALFLARITKQPGADA